MTPQRRRSISACSAAPCRRPLCLCQPASHPREGARARWHRRVAGCPALEPGQVKTSRPLPMAIAFFRSWKQGASNRAVGNQLRFSQSRASFCGIRITLASVQQSISSTHQYPVKSNTLHNTHYAHISMRSSPTKPARLRRSRQRPSPPASHTTAFWGMIGARLLRLR